MKMKIKQKWISRALIAFLILTMFFAYGYVNSMVSYKYQVQDFQQVGKDSLYGLDQEQLSIMHTITFCKIAAITSFILLILGLIVNEKEPTFNGRLNYEGSDNVLPMPTTVR